MTNTTGDWEAWLRSLPRELAALWSGAGADGSETIQSLGSEIAALGWALAELDGPADPAAAHERLRIALAALRARLHQTAPAIDRLQHAVTDFTGNALDWPPLGPLQASHADRARLERAGTRYSQAFRQWSERLLAVAEASIADFEHRLGESNDVRAGASALMDLWCQIAETRYEAELDTPEHASAYAELVNAGTEFRLAWLAVLDPVLDAVGLPSRRALADTQARVDRMAREQQQTIAELRQRLDALTGGTGRGRGGAGR